MLLEAVTDADLEAIQAKIIDKAKAGDLAAAKLIFDRLLPPPKSRAVPIKLPAIGQWYGSETVLCAYREIFRAVAEGDISPEEGLQLVSLVEAQRAAVKELRPAAMDPEPTPEQLAERKRLDEKIAEKFKSLLDD
ncbi:hypothetical protein ACVMB0_000512 [Bradyrhizobium sp. USDA 4451]